jgi:hypothetical protein
MPVATSASHPSITEARHPANSIRVCISRAPPKIHDLSTEQIINHETANEIRHSADVRSSGERVQYIIERKMIADNSGWLPKWMTFP